MGGDLAGATGWFDRVTWFGWGHRRRRRELEPGAAEYEIGVADVVDHHQFVQGHFVSIGNLGEALPRLHHVLLGFGVVGLPCRFGCGRPGGVAARGCDLSAWN